MKFSILSSLTVLIVFFSCTNPFSIREAESPDISVNSDTFEEPFLSQTVISNLRYALIQENVTNYEKCFVSENSSTQFTYRFLHDQRIEVGLLNNWTIKDELQYFSTLTTKDSLRSINVNFSNISTEEPITTHPDSVYRNFDYYISVTFDNSFFDYKGQSKLKLVKNAQGTWAIYYWEDLPAIDNYENSWSILKLKFR